jgi:hypothetical protein
MLITMNGDMTSIHVLDVMTLPKAESPFSAVTAIQPGGVFRNRKRTTQKYHSASIPAFLCFEKSKAVHGEHSKHS